MGEEVHFVTTHQRRTKGRRRCRGGYCAHVRAWKGADALPEGFSEFVLESCFCEHAVFEALEHLRLVEADTTELSERFESDTVE